MVTPTRRAALAVVLGATLLAACSVARAPFPHEPKTGTVFHSFRQPTGSGPLRVMV